MIKAAKFLICFWLVMFAVSGQTAVAADAKAPLPTPAKAVALTKSVDFNTVTTQIERIRKGLNKANISKEKIDEYSAYLTQTEAAIMANRREMEKQVKSLQKQLEALGEGHEQEDAFITQQREELTQKLAAQDRVLKEADLLVVQMEDLTVHILNVRNQKIYGDLITKHSAFLNPLVFYDGIKSYMVYFWDITKSPVEWYQNLPKEQRSYAVFSIVVMFVIVLLALGVAVFLRKMILRNWGYKQDIANPSFNRKVVAAVAVAIARGLIPMFIVGGCILWMVSTKIFEGSLLETVLMTTAYTTMLAIVETTASRVTFAPHYPQWRLVNIASEKASRFTRMIFTFILMNALANIQVFVAQQAEYSVATIHFTMIIACAIKAFFLMWFTKITFDTYRSETVEEGIESEENEDKGLKVIIFSHLFCSGIFLVSLLGYPELALFILDHIIISLILCGLFEVLRRSIIDILRKIILSGPWAKSFHHYTRIAKKVDFWLRAIINPTLVLMLVFVLLTFWGLPGDFLLAAIKKLLFGFKIGGIQISLIAIALGIAVFFGSLTVMRIIKNKLANNVLAKIDMDEGIKHSLVSGFSFVGFIVAVLLAIVSVGIDLTNLAFIAGALSVGIGFGLQDVIKNLVAGVIILLERPFRVGDWVVLSGTEGKIKQINIRSTELLSFDRTSVIIPNATLISSTVINKTHGDNMSRQGVSVGVSYGSDVNLVTKILLECAMGHKLVLKNPAPYVLFKDFGASSLDFELRVYVKDINSGWAVPSELRYAIFKRFNEEGIEIPFPQVVINQPSAPKDAAVAVEADKK